MANKKKTPLDNIKVPFGYTVVPEPKTERLNLLLGATLKEELKRISDEETKEERRKAKAKGDKNWEKLSVSVNEIVNRVLLEYVNERRDE